MAPLVLSSPVDVRQADWTFRERAPVPFDCLRRDFIQPYAADTRRSVRKVIVDEILIRADGFEDTYFTDTPSRIGDRKSTRLHSSREIISYDVFCLKKK